MKQFQETVTCKGSLTEVWASYAQVNRWQEWDHSLAASGLDSGDDRANFIEGATGWLQPKSGPKVKFVLTEVTPEVSFTSCAILPFASLAIDHKITAGEGQLTLTHIVSFSGPLGFLFGFLIGREIKKDLAQVLSNLADQSAAPKN